MKVTELTKMNETEGGERMKRLIKNNKGFSLVELLIVIAIMGVLAVIAFNMFGGVLNNSKQRADEQQGDNIGKALLTYCIDSNDWKLEAGKVSGSGITLTDVGVVTALMSTIDINGKKFGPYLSRKDPDKSISENLDAYLPQYRVGKGGTYAGWDIKIFSNEQNVKCTPGTTSNAAITRN